MAGRARLLLTAVALAPLPLLAAVAWNIEAEAARGLAPAVVSVRDGDLYVGDRQLTSGGGDSDPDWSPDRRQIAFVRQDPGKRSLEPLRGPARRRRPAAADARRAGRLAAGLARRRPPARLLREPARGRQLRRLDGRPVDGGTPTPDPRGPGRADRARLHAVGQGHGAGARPRRAVPGQDERLRHAAGRAARAATRPRPARAVPADDRRNEARLRLGDRQHRRWPGLDPRQQARRVGADARASSSSACPTAPCGRTPTPAGSATRLHRRTPTGTCSASSATSCARSRGTWSCATARAASASPTTTASPPAASRSSRAATSTATAPRATRARSPSSRGRRSASPISTPPTSTARTSSSAASRPGSTCSSTAPTRTSGSRRSTTRTTTRHCGSG